jgi:hypothetical protein
MGKRELLLIAAFVVVGVVAWRLTAPRETTGSGFSIARTVEQARNAMRGERVAAPVRETATASPGDTIKTLLVEELVANVTVIGEDRAEATAELRGNVFGVDETDSRARLAKVDLQFVDAGDVLRTAITLPETRQRRPSLELRLTVPARLAVKLVRIRGDVEVRGVAAATIDSRSGDLSVVDVPGLVRAEHRGGEVELVRIGEVKCDISLADLRVSEVRGGLDCETREGRFEARAVGGTTRVESKRTDLDFETLRGAVTIEVEDARVTVRDHAAPITFTGERGRLALTLTAPAETRITAEDAPVEVTLGRGVGAAADLEVEEAALRLPEPLQPTAGPNAKQAFVAPLNGGGRPLVVRSRRGDVTVRD